MSLIQDVAEAICGHRVTISFKNYYPLIAAEKSLRAAVEPEVRKRERLEVTAFAQSNVE